MNVDVLVHKIVSGISDHIDLDMVDQPFIIFPYMYKDDTRALGSAIKTILENRIVYNFEIVAFDDKGIHGMELNLKNALLSDYGKELAKLSSAAFRIKTMFGKVVDTYYHLQDEMNNSVEKYESYSDEELIRIAKENNFSRPSDRAIVAQLLKDRGY
ncbi:MULTISPECIES: hypothetical protein [Bacillus cereus group]|uniref:hypothetical protein n=1 Tax=Bacillus cereus group TaxID=86661 RepID=UPI0007721E00|nr:MULTISPECIES: hypothetical protein [Bacillus cereus group]ONG66883.1 hypothetical protein BKK44_20180 [Bacillus cereus]MCH5437732.1 hypothetical protein [Bacillus paranthracis]MDA1915591.1 hypothetical protein [Bacillus cereus group sp. BcHK140]MDA2195114.1 hypothetical protein [Bacillus cereus group sp. Bc238]MDA2200873.1 hypothetical protein [Bacillus cereus group sp. Bc237]